MNSPHIAFVGLMGSGKSTVGVLVAKRLKLRFVDLDAAVEAKHGAIATIFASLGEAAFRAFEYEALREAISAERAIISTGGGIGLSNRGSAGVDIRNRSREVDGGTSRVKILPRLGMRDHDTHDEQSEKRCIVPNCGR